MVIIQVGLSLFYTINVSFAMDVCQSPNLNWFHDNAFKKPLRQENCPEGCPVYKCDEASSVLVLSTWRFYNHQSLNTTQKYRNHVLSLGKVKLISLYKLKLNFDYKKTQKQVSKNYFLLKEGPVINFGHFQGSISRLFSVLTFNRGLFLVKQLISCKKIN